MCVCVHVAMPMCLCMCTCVSVCIDASDRSIRRPEEGSQATEAGLQVIVSHPTWLLEIKLRSAIRGQQVPTH